MSDEKKWHWCNDCDQEVDVDEVFDGSEVTCRGCRQVYVVVAFEGADWELHKREEEDEDDEEITDARALAESRERYPDAWKAAEQLAADPVRRAAFNAALVEPPEVRAARDRYSKASERFAAYDHADPPAKPPPEIVAEYGEAHSALARIVYNLALASQPKIVVTPVPPLTTGTSVAFVDGPGLHGMAEVPTATYPPSKRGAAMRELRQSIGASWDDVSRALRISVVEACGLERGSHTTDDAGWLEIQTALFLLGSREGAPAIPIPPEVEADYQPTHYAARGTPEHQPTSCGLLWKQGARFSWTDEPDDVKGCETCVRAARGAPMPPPEPDDEPAIGDLPPEAR